MPGLIGYWPMEYSYDDVSSSMAAGVPQQGPTFDAVSLPKITDFGTTAVEHSADAMPRRIDLVAYPNPFNPSTTIRFSISDRGSVELTVFNLLGQQVRFLSKGDMEAGSHEVRFDANNLVSGLYLCRLQFGRNVKVQKLVLLK